MIGVRISGRLGNQMFQYAFLANQALKYDRSFYLQKNGTPIDLYKYFVLKKNLFYYIDIICFDHLGFKLLFSHYLRTMFYWVIMKFAVRHLVSSPKGTDHPDELDKQYTNDILYNGYYQSPLYFNEFRAEIASYFQIKEHLVKRYAKHHSVNFKGYKTVTIHLRRTDFKDLANYDLGNSDLTLPYSYYHQVISQVHQPDNYYIFISDDPDEIEKEFNYLNNSLFSPADEITDFQHMLNADICIIANSTFSWWAAYLNAKEDKVVYCPKYYLGFHLKKEYPVGIYPHNWIQVGVIQ